MDEIKDESRAEAFRKLIETEEGRAKLFSLFNKVAEVLAEIICDLVKMIACYENKRVIYLAMHAKKWRTRKKNRNRLAKYVLKQIERTGKIDKEDSDERN